MNFFFFLFLNSGNTKCLANIFLLLFLELGKRIINFPSKVGNERPASWKERDKGCARNLQQAQGWRPTSSCSTWTRTQLTPISSQDKYLTQARSQNAISRAIFTHGVITSNLFLTPFELGRAQRSLCCFPKARHHRHKAAALSPAEFLPSQKTFFCSLKNK